MAIADFTRAIEMNPNYEEAYSERVHMFEVVVHGENVTNEEKMKYNRLLVSDYTKLIEFNPKNGKNYHRRGDAYAKLGDYSNAIVDYTKAKELNPKDYYVFSDCAEAYHNIGNYPLAIADYTRAIELLKEASREENELEKKQRFESSIDYNYQLRGESYQAFGDMQRAIADYTIAISNRRAYVETYVHRGVAYEAIGQHKKAEADYAMAERLGYNFDK